MSDIEDKYDITKGGVKYDKGKSRVDLIPSDVLMEVGKVFDYGAQKYAAHNWCNGMDWSRLVRATLGHIYRWQAGIDIDDDLQTNHLDNALCSLLMLRGLVLRKKGNDDRYIDKEALQYYKDELNNWEPVSAFFTEKKNEKLDKESNKEADNKFDIKIEVPDFNKWVEEWSNSRSYWNNIATVSSFRVPMENEYSGKLDVCIDTYKFYRDTEKQITLAIDIDGICRDFHNALVRTYVEVYPDKWYKQPFYKWALQDNFEIGDKINDFAFNNKENVKKIFFVYANIYDDVTEAIELARANNFKLIALTSQNDITEEATKQWIEYYQKANLIFFDEVIYVPHGKRKIDYYPNADYYIDDCPEYIVDAMLAGKKMFKKKFLYNKNVYAYGSVDSLLEFVKKVIKEVDVV